MSARLLPAIVLFAGCFGAFTHDASVGKKPAFADSGDGGPAADGGPRKSNGRLRTFLTDGFREDWDVVFATIARLEVVHDDGARSVVFDDPFGLAVNLRSLRDDSGRLFLLAAESDVAVAPATSIIVTLLPSMTLHPHGLTTDQVLAIDATLPRDAAGRVTIDVPLTTPRPLDGAQLVLDFDLSRFTLQNGQIVPFIEELTTDQITTVDRQAPLAMYGRISNVIATATFQSFSLTTLDDRVIDLITDAATTVVSDTAGVAGTVTEGLWARVLGTFDLGAARVLASRVTVVNGLAAAAEGSVESLSTTARTLTTTITDSVGLPGGTVSLVVRANATTRCLDGAGTVIQFPQFLQARSPGDPIAFAGHRLGSTGQFDAMVLRPITASEAGAVGTPGVLDPQMHRLTLTGLTNPLNLPSGTTTLDVLLLPTTVLIDGTGELASTLTFEALLATEQTVRVRGIPGTGTGPLRALELRIVMP